MWTHDTETNCSSLFLMLENQDLRNTIVLLICWVWFDILRNSNAIHWLTLRSVIGWAANWRIYLEWLFLSAALLQKLHNFC